MATWQREAAATIKQYGRTVEENIFEQDILLGMLKAKGRIMLNVGGDGFQWPLRFTRNELVGYADDVGISFPNFNRHKNLNLPYRELAMGEGITKGEVVRNKGKEKIIDIMSMVAESVMQDAKESFRAQFFIDGNASGNELKLHGFESGLGQHASATGDGGKTRDPDDSYAGQDTDLGAFGGSWTGDWPAGTGDPKYHAHSPILIDTTVATVWGATATFAANGNKQIRYGIIKSRRFKPSVGKTDLVLMDDTMWNDWLNLMETKEQIFTSRSKDNSLAVRLGFDAINYDGADIYFQADVPANTFYGINLSSCELRSNQGELFNVSGPNWYQPNQGYLITCDYYGNFKFSPHDTFKGKNYTA